MEKLLQFAWKHLIFPLRPLLTTDGQPVEIIDPGLRNHNQGPDFFNAKVRIGDMMWVGNVEIHVRASDWFRHGHQLDEGYNNVVLHVVKNADAEAVTKDGKCLPTLQTDLPAGLLARYEELHHTDDYPRCHHIVASIPTVKVHCWMDSLLAERLTDRARRILQRVDERRGDWERAAFVTLARNFGFGINGDALEQWARIVPLHAAAKHRDNLFQLQCLFLGTAGLLEKMDGHDGWDPGKARAEYAYLARKFALPEPPPLLWRYLRTRPHNFPHARILQLAMVYHHGAARLHALLEATDMKAVGHCFACVHLSQSALHLIAINTIGPLLYAYGQRHGDEDQMEQATMLLESLPAENNYIIRQWRGCGLQVTSAADGQALIQLKREYCDRYDCLRCQFGYEYLKRNK